jgi:hypothetical protein
MPMVQQLLTSAFQTVRLIISARSKKEHGNNQRCQQQSEEPIRARFCFDVEFQKRCLQENCCKGQCFGFGEGPSTAFLPKKESPLQTKKHEKIASLPERSTNAPKSVQPSLAKAGMVFGSSLANCLHLPQCHRLANASLFSQHAGPIRKDSLID